MGSDVFLYLEFIRTVAKYLPGVYEKPCFGTPAFYAGKSLLSRVKEDGQTVTMQTFERDKWIAAEPGTFFITDHYCNYDCMLINLKTVLPDDLKQLFITAWYNRAPKKLIKEYEEAGNIKPL